MTLTTTPPAIDTMGHRSLADLLEERAAADPSRNLVEFEAADGTVQEITYADMLARVADVAGGLAAVGVSRGDRVVLHLRNSPEFLVAWFALGYLGAVFVPSNVANAPAEVAHVVRHTEAVLAITEPHLLEGLEKGIALAGRDTRVVVARGPAGEHLGYDALVEVGRANPAPRAPVRGEDLAELIFTSGTTSKPKAVMLTHANLLRAGLDAVHCLWLEPGERCLTALPLFHVNAQAMSALAALTVGGTLILLEEFRASRFWSQIQAHGATQTAIVAMQLRTLIAQPVAPGERDHWLRRVFFAINVSDGEKEAFEERFDVRIINGYGLSEAMTLTAVSPIVGPRRWPSVGLPSPGRRVLLLDEAGEPVAPGEVGEVVVEGTPGRTLMLGYYRDEEATARALRGGRLHTGDNAYADADGYLYFFDRKKDMIKRAGENVSALEVEAAIVEHPGVAEASVVGIVDPIRDEAVAAVVVRTGPGSVDAQGVMDHCAERLSRFKVPTVVVFRDELPKTSIGKVRKDVLRAELV